MMFLYQHQESNGPNLSHVSVSGQSSQLEMCEEKLAAVVTKSHFKNTGLKLLYLQALLTLTSV